MRGFVRSSKDQFISSNPHHAMCASRIVYNTGGLKYGFYKKQNSAKMASIDESSDALVGMDDDFLALPPPGPRACKSIGEALSVTREFISSERYYVEKLGVLVNEFIRRLNMKDEVTSQTNSRFKQYGPSLDMNLVFGNLQDIFGLHEQLLEKIVVLESEYKEVELVHKIAEVFSQHAPFLKMYMWYVIGYDNAIEVLDDTRKKNLDLDFWLTVSEKLVNSSVESLLILPVQRIFKYKLLLERSSEALREAGRDDSAVEEAMIVIKQIADHMNSTINWHKSKEKVYDIQTNMFKSKVALVEPHRHFVEMGNFKIVPVKARRARRLSFSGLTSNNHVIILFNDILIIASVPKLQSAYSVIHTFDLGELEIEDIDPDLSKSNSSAFGAVISDEAARFCIDFGDEATKTHWEALITSDNHLKGLHMK